MKYGNLQPIRSFFGYQEVKEMSNKNCLFIIHVIARSHILCLLLSLFIHSLTAQSVFEEVAQQSGIDYTYSTVNYLGGGAAFFDFDNDGDEDIWIAGGVRQDVFFENDGNGNFTEIGNQIGLDAAAGNVTSGVITGDLDNDGFRDVMTIPHIGHHPLLFKNNGDGTFSEISEEAGIGLDAYKAQSHAAAMADVNLDGYLDIYLATYIDNINSIYDQSGAVVGFDHDCFEDFLFINNGDWTFTESSVEYGINNEGCALAVTFTDYDGDADADVMIANDFGEWIIPNILYQNQFPENLYSDVSQAANANPAVYGMGIAIGDYDQDLDLDYYITNLGRNVLIEYQANGIFEDKTDQRGIEDTFMSGDSLLASGWGTAFIDVDNDLDLDLFVCNGFIPSALFIDNHIYNQNRLFLNDGNPYGQGYSFSEVASGSDLADGGRGRGFAYSDYDNDGDLDFLVVNINHHTMGDPIENVLLYRNEFENNNNWLQLKLEGTINNKDAFGSVIKIVVGNHSWLHDYSGGFGSFASQHSSIAHFGLGQAEQVDSLVISWPGGSKSYHTNIPANQKIKISEDGELTTTSELSSNLMDFQMEVFPNPFADQLKVAFDLQKGSQLEIAVFDALGQKVETLKNAYLQKGTHSIYWKPPMQHPSASWYVIVLKSENSLISRKVFYQ